MIDGTATFTIVASTMIIETPRLRSARPIQRPRPLSSMAAPLAVAWLATVKRSPSTRRQVQPSAWCIVVSRNRFATQS
jgi:hypothetical protein